MTQLQLLPKSLDEQYQLWCDTQHGITVYTEAKRRALFIKSKGVRHIGIKFILESIRWDRLCQTGMDDTGYKINNNIASRLSRDIMQHTPELIGYFETRALR